MQKSEIKEEMRININILQDLNIHKENFILAQAFGHKSMDNK